MKGTQKQLTKQNQWSIITGKRGMVMTQQELIALVSTLSGLLCTVVGYFWVTMHKKVNDHEDRLTKMGAEQAKQSEKIDSIDKHISSMQETNKLILSILQDDDRALKASIEKVRSDVINYINETKKELKDDYRGEHKETRGLVNNNINKTNDLDKRVTVIEERWKD